MEQEQSFGLYVRQRRREMDLTQEELARRVGCAAITLRKIEADDLRASVQIAERLAMALAIPLEERAGFVRWARSVKPAASDLPPVTPPPAIEEIGREDLTGRAIRGYALAERIGMGGMGSVYRAVQPNVEREVAVKIILPAFANHPDFIRRFETEAQLVARLEHPHIVPLYDYWREPSVAYLVMRLLRGGNIQNRLEQGAISIETALKMLEQICSALNSAHRIGIIHRDLKPANVLLDEDSNTYLADFGIAKNLGNPEIENQTSMDAMIGSPTYMSPEQIQSHSIRPQTDIYCLGVMLYEMLTGAIPFAGPTPFDLIQQHVNAPMPPLSAHKAGLPASLDSVIAKATAKNPEERYADTLSFFHEFRNAVGRMAGLQPTIIAYEEEEIGAEIVNPFKGLRAFNESDAENFFGRESLVQQLLARLGEGGDLHRFLAVIGPSGSGKSSVVRASLIPALRRGALPGSENWFVVDMLPGKHPFEELELSLLRVAVNPPESLLSQLKDGQRGLLRAVHRILPTDDSVELVLVIDQFEEVFTLVKDEAERALFLDALAVAILDERSRLRVVITLRADFTDKPLRYVDFGEMMNRRFEFVLPLTADEVEQAVAGPAQRVGLRLEKGLVSKIVHDKGNQPGGLPLLQYALSELFEKREGRTLTNKAYSEIGGVLGALGRRAEIIFRNLNEAERSATRQLFLRLVTLGEGAADTRRRVLREELDELSTDDQQLSAVIDRYGKARLLTFDRDPVTRGATVEVAHEALLREWSQLREWLAESRNDIRLQRQLTTAATDWKNAGNDASYLLTGARLEQFESWSANTTVAISQNDRAFLEAGIRERDQLTEKERVRQQRELDAAQKLAVTERQRAEEQTHSAGQLRKRAVYLTGALVVALILGVAVLLFGRQAQASNREATSRELAAASILNLNVDPERSILLALEALEVSHTIEAEDALHRAVQASHIEMVIQANEPGYPWNVEYSPDGNYLLAGVGSAKLFNAETRELLFEVPGYFSVFSPDSKMIAAGYDDGIHFWDVPTGKELVPQGRIQYEGITFEFSPDGKRILTSSFDGIPVIWDANTGQKLVEFVGHTASARFVYFSPDGTRVISFGDDGTTRVWHAGTGEQLLELHGQGVDGTGAFTPDSKLIATTGGTSYTDIIIWDTETGEKRSTIVGHTAGVNHIEFSPDGLWIASSSSDRTVKIFDVATGREVVTLAGHTEPVIEVDFSPDGTKLATSSTDGTLRVWNIIRREVFSSYTSTNSDGQLAYNSDGTLLAVSAENGSVKVWDTNTGEIIHALRSSEKPIYDLSFSPDDKKLAVGYEDSAVRIWDISSGSMMDEIQKHTGAINGVAFNHDGTRLVTVGEDYKAVLWDVSVSPPVEMYTQFFPVAIRAAAFSPDDKLLALGIYDNTVQILNSDTGETIITLRGHTASPSAIAFSPDGSRIATSSLDDTAKVWDVKTGSELLTLSGHANQVMSIAFSPDGQRLATASRDGTARLWDSSTGQQLNTFVSGGSGLWDIAFHPNGKLLAVGEDHGGYVYLLELEDLVNLAKSRLTRTLTVDECTKYLHKSASECGAPPAAPTATPIPPTDSGRVCQVTGANGLSGVSFEEAVFRGMQNSNMQFGWDIKVLESAANTDFQKHITEFQRGDCDLIVGTSEIADAVYAAAEQNPEQKFLLIEFPFDPPLENVRTQLYATDQAAFLAGYLAASQSKTGKVGVFGGQDFPPVTDFMDGFALGVEYHNEKKGTSVEVLGWDPHKHEGVFVGNFFDTQKGRDIAQQFLDQGADVILPVAGYDPGVGAANAVKLHGDAYFIGVDFDWADGLPEYQDIVLTSILKNYAPTVELTVRSIVEDEFAGGIHFGGLETGEVGLAPFHQFDAFISPEVKAELEQIKADIIAGKIQTKP
ncbi:MAG: BMP family ABC transporter substrate-binding protein [Anaerolineales bacterium]